MQNCASRGIGRRVLRQQGPLSRQPTEEEKVEKSSLQATENDGLIRAQKDVAPRMWESRVHESRDGARFVTCQKYGRVWEGHH